MKKFVSSSPKAEIIGEAVLSFFENLQREEIAPVLAKNGLGVVDPAQWYSQQLCLDIFADIANCTTHVSTNFMAIGVKNAQLQSLPGEIGSFMSFLNRLSLHGHCVGRHTSHGDRLVVLFLAEGRALVTNDTPYPDEAVYGYLWAMARRLLGRGGRFLIRRAWTARPDSDESTVFEITWDARINQAG
jgi:hypothetical protein